MSKNIKKGCLGVISGYNGKATSQTTAQQMNGQPGPWKEETYI